MRLLASVVWVILIAISSARGGVPPERTAIFPSETAANFIQRVSIISPSGMTGYWSPTMDDLQNLETGLIEYLRKVRPEAAA
jgi:hypothetical protein